MTAKRIERTEDAVVICATATYLYNNPQLVEQINKMHPNCEAVLLIAPKEACIESMQGTMDDDNMQKAVEQLDNIFTYLEQSFVKRTYVYSTSKKTLAPLFAGQIIDKDNHSKGYIVLTQDPAYDNEQMQKIVDAIKPFCNPFHIEVL